MTKIAAAARRDDRRGQLLARTALGSVLLVLGAAAAQEAGAQTTTVGVSAITPVGTTLNSMTTNGAGSVSVTSPLGLSTEIFLGQDRTLLNWGAFNLGGADTLNFRFGTADPNAVVLNKVAGSATIDGDINSYLGFGFSPGGNVWFSAPSGVTIGGGAVINVGGFLATTANIETDNFLADNFTFSNTAAGSAVAMNGAAQIIAQDGTVALIAPVVYTDAASSITTGAKGDVLIAAAQGFRITFAAGVAGDLDLFSWIVPADSITAPLDPTDTVNSTDATTPINVNGAVTAGSVYMGAVSRTVGSVVSIGGVVTATGAVADKQGNIVLSAGGGLARTGDTMAAVAANPASPGAAPTSVNLMLQPSTGVGGDPAGALDATRNISVRSTGAITGASTTTIDAVQDVELVASGAINVGTVVFGDDYTARGQTLGASALKTNLTAISTGTGADTDRHLVLEQSAGALNLAGQGTVIANGDVTINAAGDLTLDDVSGTNVTLGSGGTLSVLGARPRTRGNYVVSAVDWGPNALNPQWLTAPLGSSFTITDRGGGFATGPLTAPRALSITTQGGGDLILSGIVSGTSVALSSTGSIKQHTTVASQILTSGALTANATGGAVDLDDSAHEVGSLDSSSGTGGFALKDADGLTVTGEVNGGTGALFLHTTGALTINSTIATNGAGSVNVSAGGAVTVNGLGRLRARGSGNVLANGASLVMSGAVSTAAGDVTLSSDTVTTIRGSTSANGQASISGGSVVLDGGNVSAFGVTVAGPVTVNNSNTLGSDSPAGVTFADAVAAGAGRLTLNLQSGAAAAFNGGVTATTLGEFRVNGGATRIAGNRLSAGLIDVDDVTFAATGPVTIDGGSGVLTGAIRLASGAQNLSVSGLNFIEIGGVASGAGTFNNVTLQVASPAGTLRLTGDVIIGGSFTAADELRIAGTSQVDIEANEINLTTVLGELGNAGLRLDANTDSAFGDVSALASLTVDGAAVLTGATYSTTGAQAYNGAVALSGHADKLFTSTGDQAISFGSTLRGVVGVTVTTAGDTTFNGAVGVDDGETFQRLGFLTVNGGGQTTVKGGVITDGNQTFSDALVLGGTGPAPIVFEARGGASLSFAGITGSRGLSAIASGDTIFNGAVNIASLATDAGVAGVTRINGVTVQTSGAQTYGDTLQINGTTALTAATASFSTVNGVAGGLADRLTINGGAAFNGQVGVALGSGLQALTVTGASTIATNNITAAELSLGGGTAAATVAGGLTLTGSTSLTLTGALNDSAPGAHALTLTGNALDIGNVGATTAFGNAAINGGISTTLRGDVASDGDLSFTGQVLLADGLRKVSGDNVAFGSVVDGVNPGAASLSVTTPGLVDFNEDVGSSVALNGLALRAGTANFTGIGFNRVNSLAVELTAPGFGFSYNNNQTLSVNTAVDGLTGLALGPKQNLLLTTSAGDLNFGSLTAADNISMGAAGNLNGANVTATNSVANIYGANVNVTGTVDGGINVLVGAPAVATATTGDIFVGTIRAGDDVQVAAGGDVQVGNLILDRDVPDAFAVALGSRAVLIDGGTSVTLGALGTPTGAFTAAATDSAGLGVNIRVITDAGLARIGLTSSSALNEVSGDSVSVQVTGAGALSLGSLTADAGSVTAQSGGGLTVGSATASGSAANDIALIAGSDLQVGGGLIGRDISLTAADFTTGALSNARLLETRDLLINDRDNFSTPVGLSAARHLTVTAGLDLTVGADGVPGDGIAAGNNISLFAGRDLFLRGGVEATGDTVTLRAGGLGVTAAAAGLINQTEGSITAATLTGRAGTGTSSADLSQANSITNLGAFAANGFRLNNLGGLRVTGTVGGGTGLTRIETTGDLTLAATATISGAKTVLSTNNAFINNSGSDAVTSPEWAIYSASPSVNVFGGLDSGATALWNGTLATRDPAAISGERYVFAAQPTATISSTSAAKTYGDDITATVLPTLFAVSGLHTGVSGAFLGDTFASAFTGAPVLTSAGAQGRARVDGGLYGVGISLGTLASPSGYAVSLSGPGLITVLARPVTLTVSADDKTYDGTTAATGSAGVTGVLSGDDATAGGGVFTFENKHAGDDKLVHVAGVTIGGADASNYSWTAPTTAAATIGRKSITLTGTADDKVYDGTTAATGALTLHDVITGDDFGVSGVFSFGDRNVGDGKTVSAALAFTGADRGNYDVSALGTLLADITPKQLLATGFANNKTYDGIRAATGSFTLDGVVGSDSVLAGGVFSFDNRNAGIGRPVSVADLHLFGGDAGNYTVDLTGSITADIFRKALGSVASAAGKTYDGATGTTGTVALTDVVEGDVVSAGGAFTFVDKHAGDGKTVNVTGVTLGGADADNYTVSSVATATATIHKKAITATGTADDKVYDGTTAANGLLTLNDAVSGDDVEVGGVFSFGDRHVGTAKAVTVADLALSGADKDNYVLSMPGAVTADITPKELVATGFAEDKTYDGTAAATGSFGLAGVLAGDVVAAGGDFSFADKTAAADKAVAVSALHLSGEHAGNYTVTLSGQIVADIFRKALTPVAAADNKTYDGTTATTGTVGLAGVVANDAVSAAGTFNFVDKDAGPNKGVNVAGISLSGVDAGNYTVALTATDVAEIFRKHITATAVADDKTYDGSRAGAGTVTLNDVVQGDDVSAGATFTFADPNAGLDKVVAVSGSVAGADAGNYVISMPTSVFADILKRAITITASSLSRQVGGRDPALTYQVSGDGLVAGESLTGALARGAGSAPGIYTVRQGTLAASSNYQVTFTGGTFTITLPPKSKGTADERLRE